MAHGAARERKWRGNWLMEWVASTLHTTSEHGVSSITTADSHASVASTRLNWRPRRFKWTRPFRRKTKSGFCACAITFQTQSTIVIPYEGWFRWRCLWGRYSKQNCNRNCSVIPKISQAPTLSPSVVLQNPICLEINPVGTPHNTLKIHKNSI
jgi:hypothetical protein